MTDDPVGEDKELVKQRNELDCAFLRAHSVYLDTAVTKWPYVNSARAISETNNRVAERLEYLSTRLAELEKREAEARALIKLFSQMLDDDDPIASLAVRTRVWLKDHTP